MSTDDLTAGATWGVPAPAYAPAVVVDGKLLVADEDLSAWALPGGRAFDPVHLGVRAIDVATWGDLAVVVADAVPLITVDRSCQR